MHDGTWIVATVRTKPDDFRAYRWRLRRVFVGSDNVLWKHFATTNGNVILC
jgi:hypothetical protein